MRLGISVPALGVLYLAVLAYQIATNIGLEVAGELGTWKTLLGFVAMIGLGLIMALHERGRGTFRIRPILYFAWFWLFLTVVVAFTSKTQLLSLFLSKYGIVTWFLSGLFTGLAVSAIERKIHDGARASRWWIRLVFFMPILMFGGVLLSLRGYALAPYTIESYQFASANMTVLLATTLLAATRWFSVVIRRISFMLQGLGVLVLGTALSYLTSRMNSTSIVLVWALLAAAYIRFSGLRLGFGNGVIFSSMAIVGGWWFMGTGAFAEFMENTRFREIGQGSYTISSISSRLELLPAFTRQFKISPLFGHYEAEVMAGFFPGEYMHSLPLSLLTHTGMVGFCSFSLAIFSLLRMQRHSFTQHGFIGSASELGDRFAYGALLAILLVASLTTFFSWIPLWFAIGYLAVGKRNPPVRKNARHASSAHVSFLPVAGEGSGGDGVER